MSTKITAERARELLAGSTPGPWKIGETWEQQTEGLYIHAGGPVVAIPEDDGINACDAPLIAAAPELAARVIDLEDELASVEKRCETWRKQALAYRAELEAIRGTSPK